MCAIAAGTNCSRRVCSYRRGQRAEVGAQHIHPLRLSSGKIGEIEDIRVGNRLQNFGHRRVVSRTYVAFVLAHRLDEKILPLTGDPRDVIAASEVGVMADVAAMLANQS